MAKIFTASVETTFHMNTVEGNVTTEHRATAMDEGGRIFVNPNPLLHADEARGLCMGVLGLESTELSWDDWRLVAPTEE